MHKYRVVESRTAESQLVLQCSTGRFHIAQGLNQLPPVGTLLFGAVPHLGFGALTDTRSGEVCRVIFGSINHPRPDVALHQGHDAGRQTSAGSD
jgi:hypothetical protein